MNPLDATLPWGPAQHALMLSGYARGGETDPAWLVTEMGMVADRKYAELAAERIAQDGGNN